MVWTKTRPATTPYKSEAAPKPAEPAPPAPGQEEVPDLPVKAAKTEAAPAFSKAAKPEIEPVKAVTPAPASKTVALPSFFKQSPSALKTVVHAIEAPVVPSSPFPVVYQLSGPTGGALERERVRGEDPYAEVPVPTGRQAFVAALIAFRLRLLLWPTAANKSSEPTPPRVRAWIPFGDGTLASRVVEAVKRYQMLKGDPEHLSAVYDPVGHPQLALELLCATDEAGIFVVRTASTYASVSNTLTHLAKVYGEADEMTPEVVVITPSTTSVSSKTRQWKEHFLSIAPSPRNSEATQNTAKALLHYLNSAESPYDPETIKEWIQPEMTPETLTAIEAFLAIQ